jgi:transposase
MKTNKTLFKKYTKKVKAKELISKCEEFKKGRQAPFWNEDSKNLSTLIPQSKKISNEEYHSLDNIPNSCVYSSGLSSKFPQISWANTDNTTRLKKNSTEFYARKLRFYPNKVQRDYLKEYFGFGRYVYNKCVAYMRDKDPQEEIKSFEDLRDKVLPSFNKLKKDPTNKEFWLLKFSKNVADRMVNRFFGGYQSAMTLKARGYNNGFEHKFLEKSEISQFLCVNYRSLTKESGLFPSKLKGNSHLKFRGKDLKYWKSLRKIDHEFVITKEYDKYYLCLTHKRDLLKTQVGQKIIALDPGVRTFLTGYDSNGNSCKLGDNFTENIRKLREKLDKFNTMKKKQSVRRRCGKLRTKISNIVSDLHKKTSNYLVKNYDIIFLPHFRVKQMISTDGNLNAETKRDMVDLSHYKFKLRLSHLSNYHNKKVVHCYENHTSMTCGNCGNLHGNLGGNKEYNCKVCGSSFDRDINAARNILIRNFTLYYSQGPDTVPQNLNN